MLPTPERQTLLRKAYALHKAYLKKSSADLERQVNQLKNDVENGQYVQGTDVTFLEYARSWLLTKKAAREMNTRKMYENIIETHLSFLEDVRLCDIRNSHFQLAINNALDKPRTCEQIEVTFKQIMKMAVADNYIGVGMYDKICADINLPKYVKKEKRPLTPEEKEAISKHDAFRLCKNVGVHSKENKLCCRRY